TGSVTIPAGSLFAPILINPQDDNQFEGDETVVIRLAEGTGYVGDTNTTHTITITDNEQADPLKGWTYATDVSHDSVASDFIGNTNVGETIYEMYGMAVKEDPDTGRIWVALNANLPITGRTVPTQWDRFTVPDGNIGWGDMFFDFSGTGNFQNALDSGQMFGVRFADTNDSGVEAGVYRGVSGKSVVSENAGFWNLDSHNRHVVEKGTGLDSSMGDLAWNDSYYYPYDRPGPVKMPNVIDSGERVGAVAIHNRTELENQGFDPSQFPQLGDEIFGFSFQKPDGMTGDFIATILEECINDGMALRGFFGSATTGPVASTGASVVVVR
ncbi:hypothetical protein PJF56_20895, partial [Roseofilum sp. BLCC_M91]